MPAGRPDAELDIDEALIRRLISAQHPDLGHLPLRHLDSGWDNVIYRLGETLTVRIPRRQIAAQLVVNEQTWLPILAGRLPIAVPAPVRIGLPDDDYPWHWSILPWYEGECADLAPPGSSEADRFADFLAALHQPAPPEAPDNPVRGVPLRVRESNTRERMTRLEQNTELLNPRLVEIWETALAAPDSDRPCWLHGDLHAQNVLVNGTGTISAIIDWGDITAGDVATDLAGIWALFDDAADRYRILERYAPDDATLARAKGWAVMFGIVLADSGLINSPRHAVAGSKLLERIGVDG
jgi:aminoglycoside phosphotransferase (APT) family kinase protein